MKALPCFLLLALAGCGAEPQAADGAPSIVTTADSGSAEATESAVAETAVDVGSVAPAFELPGSDGRTHKLVDYEGQHVVVAFFPKAFTGG